MSNSRFSARLRPVAALLGATLALGLTTLVQPAAAAPAVPAVDVVRPTITVWSPSVMPLDPNGQRILVGVTTTAAKTWAGAASVSWLHVETSGRSGTLATIRVDKNTSGLARVAVATFSDGTSAVAVTVTQGPGKAVKPFLAVANPSVTIGAGGALVGFAVTTNQPSYTAEPSKDWIKVVNLSDGGVQVQIAPNTGRARTGKIVLKAGSAREVVNISQLSPTK